MRKFEGQLTAKDMRFGIVAGRFNNFIGEKLIAGAIDTIIRHGGRREDITLVPVPGAFEIPLAAKKLAQTNSVDAIIALGVVIRGATPHFDYVCGEAASGISRVSLETDVPVAFGVITADTVDQAIERAGCKAGNKGVEAASAAIEMASLVQQIEKNSAYEN
ncbi:MAG: 6,7-dimethyl-8-ribityllumazine synthase [Bdellovibrionales bacterium]|nr:6,7-dimethyl-8-ribityllumazine synthase [Bdellovibrionales bacterium]